MNLNKCFLGGNLTRDPELRHTAKGTPVTNFSLAINKVKIAEDGTKTEFTRYPEFTAWSTMAENIVKYCRKGSGLFVECEFDEEQREDRQTGEKRRKTRFVVIGFQFLDAKKKDAGADERPATRSSLRNPEPDVDLSIGDEIPF